jgi:hypothetical protein
MQLDLEHLMNAGWECMALAEKTLMGVTQMVVSLESFKPRGPSGNFEALLGVQMACKLLIWNGS